MADSNVPVSTDLTLFLPDLLEAPAGIAHLPPGEFPDLRLCETVLSRAEVHADGPRGAEQGLFNLFGIVPSPALDLPIAAVTRLYDAGRADPYWWLRADPVCVQPDRDRLVLVAHETLALTLDEAQRLAAELNAHFAADGWHVEALHPLRWYLRATPPAQLVTQSPGPVLGEDIQHWLPVGPDAARWRGYLNEAQMLLHASPVNAAREAAGQLPVNSLWLWGGGVLPQRVPQPWVQVWSDSVLACGLAALNAVPCASPPPLRQVLIRSNALPRGAMLLHSEALQVAGTMRDPVAWLSALLQFQDQWLAPLVSALRDGRLGRVDLLPGDGRRFVVTRARLRHWWRRRRALPAWFVA